MKKLRLMCILAHPDDESLGTGGTLAKYAAEGVETYLVTATRGEHGWWGEAKDYPGPAGLGKIREGELRAAAEALGVREVNFLDYIDGDLDQADEKEVIAKIVGHIRRVQPHVVISFGADGGYGHPDHIAISQFATAAILASANAKSNVDGEPHSISKLYYMAWPAEKFAAYQSVFGELTMDVDGITRRAVPWPEWALTTVIDTADHWATVWNAVACHRSQLPGYHQLQHLPEEHHKGLWGTQEFYRAFSLVNGGRKRETDLFDGLRD